EVPPRIHMTGADDWVIRAFLLPPACGSGFKLDPLQPHVAERLPEAVHVEAELAGGEALALIFLLSLARLGLFEHLGGIGAPDHADAVVVGYDHIARLDIGAGTDHGHVDAAQAGLDRALREHALRPHREVHFVQVAHVAHASVDDQTADAARL